MKKTLALALLVLVVTLALVLLTKTQVHTSYYDTQIEATTLMQNCLDLIKDYVVANNIYIEEEDLNQTGLIGPEVSELVTTLGSEEAKRSTLNPNCAAMMVKYFKEAGLNEGAVVAVGTSGSFPGLAIATLCAATAMKLETRVIASYGASTYGATRVDFNIADILNLISDLVDFDFLAVSPGSDNDYGVGAYDGFYYENTRDLVVVLGQAEGVEFIEGTQRRIELYRDIDLFVNIGGASANTGSVIYQEGLLTEPTDKANGGLVAYYLAQGIPVVNLLYVKGLMSANDLPFDPVPLPQAGQGGVYYTTGYNIYIIISGLLLSFGLLAVGTWKGRTAGKNSKK
jgi:poly-gamma-glutamate system protein